MARKDEGHVGTPNDGEDVRSLADLALASETLRALGGPGSAARIHEAANRPSSAFSHRESAKYHRHA